MAGDCWIGIYREKRQEVSGGSPRRVDWDLQKSKGTTREIRSSGIQWNNKRDARGEGAGHNGGREQEKEKGWGLGRRESEEAIYAGRAYSTGFSPILVPVVGFSPTNWLQMEGDQRKFGVLGSLRGLH